MAPGCQSSPLEPLGLSQGAITLSCREAVKRGKLKGALQRIGNNLVPHPMIPYQATGGLIRQPEDPRCSK